MKITMTLVEKREIVFNGKPQIKLTFVDSKSVSVHESGYRQAVVKLCIFSENDAEFSGYHAGDKVQLSLGVGVS